MQSPPQVQGACIGPAQTGVALRQGLVDVVVVDVVVVVVEVVVDVEVEVLVLVVVEVLVVVGTHGVPVHPAQSASWTLTLPWSSGMVAGQALHEVPGDAVPVQPIMSGSSSAST